LLLLRISVAAILLDSERRLGGLPSALLHGIAGLAFVLSFALIIGLLTPWLSSLTCLAIVARLLYSPSVEIVSVVAAALTTAALALLGPGAYSLDARLYGRRVTVVQTRKEVDP